MRPPPFEGELRVVREAGAARRYLVIAIALVGAVAVAAIWLASTAAGVRPHTSALASLALAGVGVRIARFVNARPSIRSARVRASAAGIMVDGERSVPSSAISDAQYESEGDEGGRVRILDAWQRVLFEAQLDDKTGAELLAALGWDLGQRRFSFVGGSPLDATPFRRIAARLGPAVAIIVALGASDAKTLAGGAALAGTALVAFVVWGLLRKRGTIDVGLDGLLVSWLGRDLFLRHDAIADIGCVGRDMRIELADGRVLPIAVDSAPRARALIARLNEAREKIGTFDSPSHLVERLRNRGQSAASWRAQLANVREGGPSRAPSFTEESLWSVLEDPAAPGDARAASAVLLRGNVERLRIAARAVASRPLRRALEVVSSPTVEDREIEEALDPFVD